MHHQQNLVRVGGEYCSSSRDYSFDSGVGMIIFIFKLIVLMWAMGRNGRFGNRCLYNDDFLGFLWAVIVCVVLGIIFSDLISLGI